MGREAERDTVDRDRERDREWENGRMGEDPRDIVALLVFWEFGLDSRYVATSLRRY